MPRRYNPEYKNKSSEGGAVGGRELLCPVRLPPEDLMRVYGHKDQDQIDKEKEAEAARAEAIDGEYEDVTPM